MYKSTTAFFSVSCPATLQKLLIRDGVLVESLRFSTYKIMLSENREILHFPFWFWCLLFLFFAGFLWLGLPLPCWIQMVRVGTLFLFLITEETFSVLLLSIINSLYYVEVYSLYLVCWKSFFFFIMDLEFCHAVCIYWDDMIFISHLINVMCHFSWLGYVELS